MGYKQIRSSGTVSTVSAAACVSAQNGITGITPHLGDGADAATGKSALPPFRRVPWGSKVGRESGEGSS